MMVKNHGSRPGIARMNRPRTRPVMPALVAGIHVFFDVQEEKTWMAGTSPAMTVWDAINGRRYWIVQPQHIRLVMPAPFVGIHNLLWCRQKKTWMAGTSPAMTLRE